MPLKQWSSVWSEPFGPSPCLLFFVCLMELWPQIRPLVEQELLSDLDSQKSHSNKSAPASTGARSDVTTMMLRNVPKHLSQADLVAELNASGFMHAFDFCYLPRHFESAENRGYAFVT